MTKASKGRRKKTRWTGCWIAILILFNTGNGGGLRVCVEAGERKVDRGKEKAKLFLTWRTKSEILRAIFEVGYVSGYPRCTLRSNPRVVSLS